MDTMKAKTDSGLVAAYSSSQDEAAFAEIVSRHGPMVYRVCLGLLGDSHEAEDCSQAVFVVLALKARSLRRKLKLAAWLYGVARHVSLRAIEARGNRARREEGAAMIRQAGQEQASGADRLDLRDLVYREMGTLSSGERQAVILHHLEGRSVKDAAEIAGCPQGTLGRRASQGLARLRQRLGKREHHLAALPLAGLLKAETEVAIPEALLPSLLATSKLAATGAAAGVAGGNVLALAKGVIKMMFWTKVKIALGVFGVVAVMGVGVPAASRAMRAGEATLPVNVPAAVKLKSEWKGKLLVQMTSTGSGKPNWSPCGRHVAVPYAKYTGQRGGPSYKLVEIGIEVIDLATGKIGKIKIPLAGKKAEVGLLTWQTDGKSLLVVTGKKVWSVTPGAGAGQAKLVTEKPEMGDPISFSPDGRLLLCRQPNPKKWHALQEYRVLDVKAGKFVATFKAQPSSDMAIGPPRRAPLWSRDGKLLLYGAKDELHRLSLPDGKAIKLFGARDFFEGKPPANSTAGHIWFPQVLVALADGRLVVEMYEAFDPDKPLKNRGFAVTRVFVAVWNPGGGEKRFRRLGEAVYGMTQPAPPGAAKDGARRSPPRGQIRVTFVPLGSRGLLLRKSEVQHFGAGGGGAPGGPRAGGAESEDGRSLHLIEATTGKSFKLTPPRRPVGVRSSRERISLLTSSLDKGRAFFSVSYGNSLGPEYTGILILDTRTRKFTRVKLPFRPSRAILAPAAGLLVVVGTIPAKRGEEWQPGRGGLWLCDPAGREVLRSKVDPRLVEDARKRKVAELQKYAAMFSVEAAEKYSKKHGGKYSIAGHYANSLDNYIKPLDELGEKAEAARLREVQARLKKMQEKWRRRTGKNKAKPEVF